MLYVEWKREGDVGILCPTIFSLLTAITLCHSQSTHCCLSFKSFYLEEIVVGL